MCKVNQFGHCWCKVQLMMGLTWAECWSRRAGRSQNWAVRIAENMGRNIIVKNWRGAAAAVAAFVLLALGGAAMRLIAPEMVRHTGFPFGYDYSLLRWGSIHTEARPGAWLIGSTKRRSSLTLAFAGEIIVLSLDTEVQSGWISLSVVRGLIGYNPIYTVDIQSSHTEKIVVQVPTTGVYRISANYIFGFRGRNDLHWMVE
jgi:hypothetical protein